MMVSVEKGQNTRQQFVTVRLNAKEAVEFGRWLETEPHGDVELGHELVKSAHDLWEMEP